MFPASDWSTVVRIYPCFLRLIGTVVRIYPRFLCLIGTVVRIYPRFLRLIGPPDGVGAGGSGPEPAAGGERGYAARPHGGELHAVRARRRAVVAPGQRYV
eukprot:9221393-Pyramimonas_sp.AAC.1